MIHVSPGVYWREIDLSRYIPNLSSTIAAIVGTSTKGPSNKATLVTNVGGLTSIFGVPDPDHLATYAAAEFLRNGSQLWFVRVNGYTASTATVDVDGQTAAASVLGSNRGPFTLAAAGFPIVTGTDAGATVATIDSTNQNLRLSINGSSPINIALTPGTTVTKATIAGEINTAITAYGGSCTVDTNHIVITTTTSPDGQEAHSSVQILATTNDAYTILGFTAATTNGTNSNLTFQVTPFVDGTAGTVANITLGAGAGLTLDAVITDLNAKLTSASSPVRAVNYSGYIKLYHTTADQHNGFELTVDRTSASVVGALGTLGFLEGVTYTGRGVSPAAATLSISALSPGAWGNDVQVSITPGSSADTFKMTVLDAGEAVEVFDNLVGTHETEDLTKGKKYFLTAINGTGAANVSKYIIVADDLTNTGYPAYGLFTLVGGDDGMESVSDDDFIGTVNGTVKTGLQILSNAEEIDVNLILCPGVHSAPVINEMIAISETRGDCMCIVDPPLGLGVQQIVDWHNGAAGYGDHGAFNSSYAALYWPWCEIFDPAHDRYIWTPPSGHVASIYAYTDLVAELWFAPAGFNRGRVLQVTRIEQSTSQGDRDYMYGDQNAVNPIVKFQKDGIVVWGQRTLHRDPTALDRVNVRRLMLYLRKVITTAVKYLVFEPNDSATWRAFVALVDPFLRGVRRRRGIVNYMIVCDETTNTPDHIDNNEMYAKIFINPTRAAEKILIDAILTPSGASFSEMIY